MTGLRAALAALADEWERPGPKVVGTPEDAAAVLRALLAEHPADLPVATDSTTASLSPSERARRWELRVADDLLESPGGNCQRGAHDACQFRVDCPCVCHDAPAPEPSDRAGLSETELRDVRAAFERDRWAGEFNSLPTAIDRVLSRRADRLAVAEQEQGEADRQREARDRWIGIAQQFKAKTEAAQQEAASLRERLAELGGGH